MKTNENRFAEFDFLRALAIWYIVGVRHLDDYASNLFLSKFDTAITYIFLGLLIFLSGYLLSKSKLSINSKQTIWLFIKKRFFRIYPLYLFALLLFALCNLMESKSLLSHIFLINIFLNDSVSTLWFVSLICFCYLLFPVFMYKYSTAKTVILGVFICLMLCFLHLYFEIIDKRLIILLPLFIFGIVAAKNYIFWGFMKNKYIIVFLSIICLAAVNRYFYGSKVQDIYLMIFIMAAISPCIVIGEIITNKLVKYKDIIYDLSNASFCMYLFHRVIYSLLLKIYYPQNRIYTVIYLWIIGLPLIYVVSRKIQIVYDSILDKTILYQEKYERNRS